MKRLNLARLLSMHWDVKYLLPTHITASEIHPKSKARHYMS